MHQLGLIWKSACVSPVRLPALSFRPLQSMSRRHRRGRVVEGAPCSFTQRRKSTRLLEDMQAEWMQVKQQHTYKIVSLNKAWHLHFSVFYLGVKERTLHVLTVGEEAACTFGLDWLRCCGHNRFRNKQGHVEQLLITMCLITAVMINYLAWVGGHLRFCGWREWRDSLVWCSGRRIYNLDGRKGIYPQTYSLEMSFEKNTLKKMIEWLLNGTPATVEE